MQKWQKTTRWVMAWSPSSSRSPSRSREEARQPQSTAPRVARPIQKAVLESIRRPSSVTHRTKTRSDVRDQLGQDADLRRRLEQADRREGDHRTRRQTTFEITGKEGEVGDKRGGRSKCIGTSHVKVERRPGSARPNTPPSRSGRYRAGAGRRWSSRADT